MDAERDLDREQGQRPEVVEHLRNRLRLQQRDDLRSAELLVVLEAVVGEVLVHVAKGLHLNRRPEVIRAVMLDGCP